MDRVRLGRTGLNVSVACLGTGGRSRLGQARGGSFDDAVAVVHAALDHGINHIDTAANYGTEPAVGAAVKGRRDEVVLATKIHPFRSSDGGHVTGPEFVELVEASLSRLGTSYVDILYLHGVAPAAYPYCVDELLPVLDRLREQGKVRHTGVSERFAGDPGHAMLRTAVRDGFFDVVMVGLNVVNQSAATDILPAARNADIGTMIMYAVRGKLASREGSRSVVAEAINRGEVDAADVDPDDPLGFLVAAGVAESLTEACYRFARHTPGADVVLTGTGSVAHLIDNVAAINGGRLPEQALDRLSRVFGRVRSVSAD